jgi:ubiquinone/menaquinone biosynthesis C-methylase UbiE
MNKVCFIQCHYTDEFSLLHEERNPINKLLKSNIFDKIVLGVADIEKNKNIFDKYALEYGVEVFYGSSLDIVNRMLKICEVYNADLLSRILINWNYIDIELIENMINYCESIKEFDYCMLPFDFDIKFGCDIHSLSGLVKLNEYLLKDLKKHEKYSFRPWKLLESNKYFNTVTFSKVPEYSNKKFMKLRNELLEKAPVSWDYGSIFYYHEYEAAKNYISEKDIALDISCGQGNGSAVLAQKCDTIYAYDVEEAYINKGKERYSKKHPNINFILGEPDNTLELQDNSITFAVSIHTMEHVENDLKFLSEIHRVLQENGKLYLEVPVRVKNPFSGNNEPLLPHTENFAGHYREYSTDSFQELVENYFDVIEIKGVSRGAYVPVENTRNAVMAFLRKK